MIDESIVRRLESIAGAENVSAATGDRLTHSYDATKQEFLPDVVVYAENRQQVQQIVTLAHDNKIAILPRGAGSGFSGGSLPVQGGIVLVLTRMNAILSIDSDNLTAVVQPGVVTADLQRAVEKQGLFYPPDPASKEFSTLGGNVAECAGGPRCVKYGVTKDFVLGLEVVTPRGEVIRTGGHTLKNVVGYDLTKLIVGSEGTLGVVTEIILKLLPRPEAKKTMLVQFETIEGAAAAVAEIIRARIIPTTLEFMDGATIDCIRGTSKIELPPSCSAVLILEVDGDAALIEQQADKILAVIEPLGVVDVQVAENHEESEEIWQLRRNVSPNLRKINPNKFNEDIVVPRSKVPDMIRALERLAREYGVAIVNFGHAGDGNIHVNVMVDLREQGMQQKVDEVMEKIFAAAVALKGSISGEHGIGTSKARYLAMELDDVTIGYMRAVKQAFDPCNIMNPGKIFF
ncbi:MAG: FAD-binding oxidoreductase [Desulfopila sp.]